jgi:hypothetical protein
MPTVDSATVTLDHGGTDSLTLNWSTSTDDKGDWTATANDPVGGSDSTSVSVVETHTRTTTAISPGGDAVVTRVLDGARSTLASGAGDAVVTRTAAISRTTSADGTGDAIVTRSSTSARTTLAESPGGDATVSRSVVAVRTTTATSPGGDASTSWRAVRAWAVPNETGVARVLLEPITVQTDHDVVSFGAVVPAAKKDALEYLEAAGDVDREETAYGAFRRISRGALDPITVTPPEKLVPPFSERKVHPAGYSVSEAGEDRWELSLDLGLDRPRAREPPAITGDAEVVSTSTVGVDAESTNTVTMTWTPSGSDLGEHLVTASIEETYAHPATSDSTTVTVSNAEWVLDFGVTSMNLTRETIRRISRSSSNGVTSVDLPIAVDSELAADIFAAGSRVGASQIRQLPDAGNVPVDPLPDEDLTIELVAPDDAEVDTGTYVLDSWSAAREDATADPYEFELTLLRQR